MNARDIQFTPKEMREVLAQVREQCDELREQPIRLSVDGMAEEKISFYCRALNELKLIEVEKFWDSKFDRYYPLCITYEGTALLEENQKDFWELAEAALIEAAKHWTGVELTQFIKFFKSAWRKHNQEIQ